MINIIDYTQPLPSDSTSNVASANILLHRRLRSSCSGRLFVPGVQTNIEASAVLVAAPTLCGIHSMLVLGE